MKPRLYLASSSKLPGYLATIMVGSFKFGINVQSSAEATNRFALGHTVRVDETQAPHNYQISPIDLQRQQDAQYVGVRPYNQASTGTIAAPREIKRLGTKMQ